MLKQILNDTVSFLSSQFEWAPHWWEWHLGHLPGGGGVWQPYPILQAQSASRLPVQSDSTAGTEHCTAQSWKQDRLLQAQSASRLPVQSDCTAGTVHCTAQRRKQDRLLQAQSASRLPVPSDSTAGTVNCSVQHNAEGRKECQYPAIEDVFQTLTSTVYRP
jgi:hypothetical protein